MIRFREAHRAEVPVVVALLRDDVLGHGREDDDMDRYLAAFDRMKEEGGNQLIVGVDEDDVVQATYQLTFISGLSLRAARRAQVESVRVAGHLRGQGTGAAMLQDAQDRARAAGCQLMQLTMNASRTDAHRFYEGLGFSPSHIGFKLPLCD